MRICSPCSTLGLSGTVLQTKYGVTAECLTHAELLFVDAAYLRRRIADSAEFGMTVSRQLSDENVTTYDQVRSVFLAHCARERVAQTLLVIANITPEHMGPTPLPAGLRHEDLAEYAGISRETVTRVLADFRIKGIIENEGHRMTLVNPAALQKIVGG
jgi:CRP/FNR family transcriptional regulator